MKKIILFLSLIVITFVFAGGPVIADALSSVSGKNFSIVYSSDERGAITPCG
ncbi:MAG: hypothetical protein J7L25_08850 [Deltaproteobacteria bacterium]|nr:hypothetical protein [Candidatus Tharpella aukensis]